MLQAVLVTSITGTCNLLHTVTYVNFMVIWIFFVWLTFSIGMNQFARKLSKKNVKCLIHRSSVLRELNWWQSRSVDNLRGFVSNIIIRCVSLDDFCPSCLFLPHAACRFVLCICAASINVSTCIGDWKPFAACLLNVVVCRPHMFKIIIGMIIKHACEKVSVLLVDLRVK